MEWKKICENNDAIEIIMHLLETLNKLCIEGVPKKNNEGKKGGTTKEVKKLLNRIKMLKREKHKAHSKEKKKSLKIKYQRQKKI